ncbi:thiazole synthase [Teredinibacter haidensis]|uniref:thiazole synthase n=1 Tax=Teredinibacter haidensis TaxID=2731755 RepID=UPI00163C2552|nr:thiazole synthase [Teredinibacter haidensis]
MSLTIADKQFQSRLFMGSGKFSTVQQMCEAVKDSNSQMVTVALKRINWQQGAEDITQPLLQSGVNLLPNTSGARNAEEAIYLARLGRELLGTHWVKLEIHPDQRYLMPDPVETLAAAKALVAEGFIVLPYIHADPVMCKKLEAAGCAAVMPLAAPIGSNQGLVAEKFLSIILEQSTVPVVVDAGLGAPSDAAKALEMGADAVLVNTAITSAEEPVQMARAFAMAVEGGRLAFESGLGRRSFTAHATSPLSTFAEALL